MLLNNNQNYFIFSTISILFLFLNNFWTHYPVYDDELFRDWQYIYNYSKCIDNYLNYKIIDCNSLLSSKFVYPKIWLSLGKINIPIFKIILFLTIFLFYLSTFYFFKTNQKIYHLLFLFSPVTILLIQRGNNELIIFLLVLLFAILITSKKYRFISFLPFFLASILKIYPFSLSFLFIIIDFKKINIFKISSVILILFSLIIYFDDILFLNENFKNVSGKVKLVYSSETVFIIINYISEIIKYDFKYLIYISFFILLLLTLNLKIKLSKKNNFKNQIFFLTGSSILVASFFISKSYDYRLVYILFTIPYLLDLKKEDTSPIISIFISLVYICLWFEFLIFYSPIFFDYSKIYAVEKFNNFKLIYGSLIMIKNIIYWIINFGLIVISKNIIFMKFINKKSF